MSGVVQPQARVLVWADSWCVSNLWNGGSCISLPFFPHTRRSHRCCARHIWYVAPQAHTVRASWQPSQSTWGFSRTSDELRHLPDASIADVGDMVLSSTECRPGRRSGCYRLTVHGGLSRLLFQLTSATETNQTDAAMCASPWIGPAAHGVSQQANEDISTVGA